MLVISTSQNCAWSSWSSDSLQISVSVAENSFLFALSVHTVVIDILLCFYEPWLQKPQQEMQ